MDLTLAEAEAIRDRLRKQLEARLPAIKDLHDYYDGDHPLPPLPEKCNEDVKKLREQSLLNLCPLVVNAVDERLEVQGFQFSDSVEAAGDLPDVWETVWQPNQLDAVSGLVMQEALIARRSFCLVWPNETSVDIFPEVPAEVIVDYEPGTRRMRRYALKLFTEGKGQSKTTDVTLWTDTEVWRWTSTGSTKQLTLEEPSPSRNPLGEVPVVEFLSLPDLRGVPHSELDRGVVKIQDRITKTVFDRMVLQEFQAFPQRWATGLDPETDDNGNPIAPFKTGPNRIAVNEDKDVKFGQWDAADLKPLLDAASADIHALAAVTKTPVHYLAAEFSNVSADAIRAAEAGLVKKVVGHQRTFGESWEDVIRLALKATGDPRAADQGSFIEWSDPESRTVAELADATMKLTPFLPQDEVWRRLGYAQQTRAVFATQMLQQALQNRLNTPQPNRPLEQVTAGG